MSKNDLEYYEKSLSLYEPDDSTRIILRCPLHKDTYFNIDKEKISSIFELRGKIKEYLNLENNESLKLFFKGKMLEDFRELSEFNIENDDVILYIITGNNKRSSNPCLIEYFSKNPNDKRGFSKLKEHGSKDEEIQEIREHFHSNYVDNKNDDIISLVDNLLSKEEDWLNNQIVKDIYNMNKYDNNLIGKKEDNSIKERNESNYVYIYAFLIGFSLNIYSILLVK